MSIRERSHPVLVCVVGARPNFMKMAPVVAALKRHGRLTPYLVHTGQHYDAGMSDTFFSELDIPLPDVTLAVGSCSHAVQTAEVMKRFEPVLDAIPNVAATLVVGDVNSTLACALVAAKRHCRVVHVEAGLRSYDRRMPEEINRLLTDQISDLLFTTESGASANLVREGIAPERIHFVGNVMIDSLFNHLPRAIAARQTIAAGTGQGHVDDYALLTLHRPSNVDDLQVLRRLLDVIADVAERIPVRFPVHPRTRLRIEQADLMQRLRRSQIVPLPPAPYLTMLGLMRDARLVLTDSGGVQEETTALGIPCLTLRPNTERPITVEQGTNTVVGTDPGAITAGVLEVLNHGGKTSRRPTLWDGNAAGRIAAVLHDVLLHG